MTEKSSCVTRVPASTCCSSSWEVTVADPVPEAVRDNVLPPNSQHSSRPGCGCMLAQLICLRTAGSRIVCASPAVCLNFVSRMLTESKHSFVGCQLTNKLGKVCVFNTRLSAQDCSPGRQWGHVVQEPTHLSGQWTTHNFPGCSAWSHQSDAWEWLPIFSFYFLRGHAVVPKHLISQNGFLSWWVLQGNQQSEVNSQKVIRSFLG